MLEGIAKNWISHLSRAIGKSFLSLFLYPSLEFFTAFPFYLLFIE
jgi:hypothetical protein